MPAFVACPVYGYKPRTHPFDPSDEGRSGRIEDLVTFLADP